MNRSVPVASGRLRERLALIMSAGSLMTLTAVQAEAQTLEVYLRAGRTVSVQGRLAELTDDEADARLAVARARLLPSFTATGSYRRNQYEAVATIPDGEGGFQTGTFTPYDQLEATLVIDVPLFDLTAIRSLAAARRGRAAGEASRELALLEVDRAVARAFYDAVATAELLASAERSAEVAAENLTVIEARVRAGLSSELELERARAEAARSRERVSDAARLRAEAQRRLRVLTDLAAPPAGETAPPELDGDGTLEAHLGELADLPSVRTAEANADAARAELSAVRSGFAPRISASASERMTNGAGFGYSPAWAVGVTATMRLGADTTANARLARITAERRELEAERARIDAATAIETAFDRVTALVARVTATRSEEEAAERAASIAHNRFEAGLATQLDVLGADRDAFTAEVARVQAEADLHYARIDLRMAAGRWEAP